MSRLYPVMFGRVRASAAEDVERQPVAVGESVVQGFPLDVADGFSELGDAPRASVGQAGRDAPRQGREEVSERTVALARLKGAMTFEAYDGVPGTVMGEVARAADETKPFGPVVVDVSQHPELRVEQVTRPRRLDLMDHRFKERQKIVALRGHGDVAGLAEDVDQVGVVANRLEDAERIGRCRQVSACESERHRQQGRKVEGERGCHRVLQPIARRRRSQQVDKQCAFVRRQHSRRIPQREDRREYR